MCQGEAWVCARSVSVRCLLFSSALSLQLAASVGLGPGALGCLVCVCGGFECQAFCLVVASGKCVKC